MIEWRVFCGFLLFNKVLRRGGDEWKCQCDRRLQLSLCGVRRGPECVFTLKVSAHYQKSCIWSFQQGTDMTTCPCTGTCSAVGPSDRSNTCSRNKPTQFLPGYNLREPPSVFTILHTDTHTLLSQTTEIYSLNLRIKRPKPKTKPGGNVWNVFTLSLKFVYIKSSSSFNY